ncbi:MAG: hypothetical protein OXE57_19975 [Alphaproteobacteria bacterium]|nr:hypothetical protein [Alphaproteobacteria bacterium]
MSSTVTFTRVSNDEARIHDVDGDYVGDLFRQRDILNPASSFFVIHLSEEHVAARDMLRRSRIICVAIGATRTAAT